MFYYWDGLEIDGSDTDFSIALPENVQLAELAECFVDMPLLSGQPQPDFFYYKGKKRHTIPRRDFLELLRGGNYHTALVEVNCRHPEDLPEGLRREIYAISARRDPHEEAFEKAEYPCIAPIRQAYFTRGFLTVSLIFDGGTVCAEEGLDGYITNGALIENSNQPLPAVTLNVGPGFFYEYAIYIVDYLRECFPSVATFGGLDCMGGWTGGCTYANSLYQFERIDLPVRYSVKNTLKRLMECDVLSPCVWVYGGYKTGWIAQRTNGVVLAGSASEYTVNAHGGKDVKEMTFSDYVNHVEGLLAGAGSEFDTICGTALHIVLPGPGHYWMCGSAKETLLQAYGAADKKGGQAREGYFAFFRRDGKDYAQFRVPYKRKHYFKTLLGLLECGGLDAIKPEVYRRRQRGT